MSIRHIASIAEYHTYIGWPPAEHPFMSVLCFGDDAWMFENARLSSPPISTDFYTIKFVEDCALSFSYGRTTYDFSNGSLAFIGPNQVQAWDCDAFPRRGVMLHIHKDYFYGSQVETAIKNCAFFSYNTNEALHLAPREEAIIEGILQTIRSEYRDNPDTFSRDIILSHINSILKYADRFYSRQFINRAELNQHLSNTFNGRLRDDFSSGSMAKNGLPSVETLAHQLGVSPRYLSDTLRAETGKTAQELIHLFLIEEAKNLLLGPSQSVSKTAYALGFENPPYFSRLFRKKVGMTPTEFQRRVKPH